MASDSSRIEWVAFGGWISKNEKRTVSERTQKGEGLSPKGNMKTLLQGRQK